MTYITNFIYIYMFVMYDFYCPPKVLKCAKWNPKELPLVGQLTHIGTIMRVKYNKYSGQLIHIHLSCQKGDSCTNDWFTYWVSLSHKFPSVYLNIPITILKRLYREETKFQDDSSRSMRRLVYAPGNNVLSALPSNSNAPAILFAATFAGVSPWLWRDFFSATKTKETQLLLCHCTRTNWDCTILYLNYMVCRKSRTRMRKILHSPSALTCIIQSYARLGCIAIYY